MSVFCVDKFLESNPVYDALLSSVPEVNVISHNRFEVCLQPVECMYVLNWSKLWLFAKDTQVESAVDFELGRVGMV